MPKNTYTEEYEEFWKYWPGRWNAESDRVIKVCKYEAYLEWKKIAEDEQKVILELAKSGKIKRAGTAFLPDANRWLKRRRWDDFE